MTNQSGARNVTFAFLDTNIVLEGKQLSDLPWQEISSSGLIRAYIVPTAMAEIDSKKRDGRLAKYARAFNRMIGDSVISGDPIILREIDPRVELELAMCSRINWIDYDDLDPNDGDSRIVAEILNARNIDSSDRLLISHDVKPLAFAKARGLSVYKATDEWLRGPEPSPKDKEIQRLSQQLANFKKEEPEFNISIELSNSHPLSIYRVSAPSEVEASDLMAAIKRANPIKANGRSDTYGLNLNMGDHDSGYVAKYDNYISNLVPKFVSIIDKKLEVIFNQRFFSVNIINSGPLRADNLVITIRTNDGWMNENIVSVNPGGPVPPYPRPDYMRNLDFSDRLIRNINPSRVGRHEFETILDLRRGKELQEACEDFRSGQQYHFSGVVMPTPNAGQLEIVVTLTAKNLRGERIERFVVEKEIIDMKSDDLLDFRTLELKKSYPTEAELDRLIAAEKYRKIDFDE